MKVIRVLFFMCLSVNSIAQVTPTHYHIDRFSIPVALTAAFRDTNILWSATGFFLKVNSRMYFITNDHVIGGPFYKDQYWKDHKKDPPVDSIPNHLQVRVAEAALGEYGILTLPLVENGKQKWIDFYEKDREKRAKLDVVAIPISDTLSKYFNPYQYLDTTIINRNLALSPGSDLYIVGFPSFYGMNNIYPIWKRGTIASQPLAVDLNSSFLIDATTRGGMSGSPVFVRGNSFNIKENESYLTSLIIFQKNVTFLIGVYHSQDYDSEIGEIIRIEKIISKLSTLSN